MESQTVRRIYRRPPLLEAVVEFQFEPPPGGWKSVFFGKIHSRIEAEFPLVETFTGAQVQFGPEGGSVALGAAPEINRFIRDDGGVVATVGPDILGLSVLPPKIESGHPGWEWLRDRTLDLLQTYRETANPGRIRRVGVRYINVLPITPGEFQLDNFVAAESEFVPGVLLEEHNPFSYRIERSRGPGKEGHRTEVIHLSAQPIRPNTARLMVDVDQLWIPGAGVELQDARPVLQALHDAVQAVFERVIHPGVLDSFEPVEEGR
ncbi:MAG: TIGR04255 family protein [Longimicrobiaceae bacterium]